MKLPTKSKGFQGDMLKTPISVNRTHLIRQFKSEKGLQTHFNIEAIYLFTQNPSFKWNVNNTTENSQNDRH